MAFSTGFWAGGTEGTYQNMNLCLLGWGLYSEFPAAAAGNKGALAFATDRNMVYSSTGSVWQQTAITPPASLAQGDIIYFNGTTWARLGYGTSGQFLKTNGVSANPAWADVSMNTVSQAVVTGSRAINGTVYHNTSGKIIIATISVALISPSSVSDSSVAYYCDSAASPTTLIAIIDNFDPATSGASQSVMAVTIIIPNGYYYKAVSSTAGAGSTNLLYWTEWTLF